MQDLLIKLAVTLLFGLPSSLAFVPACAVVVNRMIMHGDAM
jgi:hypothetical protein